MKKQWILPEIKDSQLVELLARELHLPLPIASLLVSRGFTTLEEASSFLEPRLANLRPPEEIPGISLAVERLHTALQKKERIVLYGDYDVDGISSLALLCRVLKAMGAGSVDCFIPERAREGYGLSIAGVEHCLTSFQPSLIVAVDCGTNSINEAKLIRERGVDLIVVDHHELASDSVENTCTYLVNPQKTKVLPFRRNETQCETDEARGTQNFDLGCISTYCPSQDSSPTQHSSSLPQIAVDGYHYLCTVGLIFKLCHALLKRLPNPDLDLRRYLDLVALGTVADIVPLVGENRIFVRYGLRQLANSQWAGVRALIKVAEIKPPFTAMDIGYKLGPRINAAGRLSSAQEALTLLLSDDATEAARIARHLDIRNRERQTIERAVTLEAEEWVTKHLDPVNQKSIVLGNAGWHQGVVGIVASRLTKRWHRPTLVIGFDEQGRGKGSGRSIEGFSLVEALEHCSPLLDAFGGHAMAAGLTLQESRLEELRHAFEKAANHFLKEEDLIPRLKLQAEVDFKEIDFDWLDTQDRLAPFGTANPQPLFIAYSVRPIKEPRILKEKHLRLEFASQQGAPIAAIFFNGAMDPLPEAPWDIAFTLERNSYQGRTTIQLQVVALREAE
ncbi:MAG: hypothetical protein A3F67_04700 [Verrucomicrobia bacterium RIFCSPHIGHO2_12_FULL_41_10]|nr:MAG: hypothetical protein A3F67_04700 [Verrucomicrobia bacterium RIFCSPHIGHO2_12_FULL_41_10]HLB34236.1 DHH family phosphoesterase [Chthoniobacterales bacterium]